MIRAFIGLLVVAATVSTAIAADTAPEKQTPDDFSRVEMCVYQNLNNPTRGVLHYSVIDEKGKNITENYDGIEKYLSEADMAQLKKIFDGALDKVSAKFDLETPKTTEITPEEVKPVAPPPAPKVKAEPTAAPVVEEVKPEPTAVPTAEEVKPEPTATPEPVKVEEPVNGDKTEAVNGQEVTPEPTRTPKPRRSNTNF